MKRLKWLLSITLLMLTGLVTSALAANSLTLNAVQVFGTIDPAKITDYTQYMAAINLYDGLLGVSDTGSVTPHVAKSWTISQDGKTYTFELQPGIKFHDGSELTADDVVYSIRRVLALGQGPAYLWQDILKPEDVTAEGKYTVKFTLNKDFSPFLATLPVLFIVNEKGLQAHAKSGKFGKQGDYGQDWLNAHDAGSGPYTLKSWTRGSEMTFAKFPDYFEGWHEGSYDTVRVVITDDETTVLSMAKTGRLQLTSEFQANTTYNALSKLPDWHVIAPPTNTLMYLKLNTQRAPTDDVHVRRAIAYAIDYKTLLKSIYPGATPQGLLAPSIDVHDPDIPEISQDIQKAKNELSQSKYAGKPIQLTLTYVAGDAMEQQVGLLIKSNLAQIGITTNLQPEPWNRITEIATSVDTTPQATVVFYGPTYPSADSAFYTQYDSHASHTWASMSWLNDAQVDNMIETARTTTDPQALKEIYYKLQERLFDLLPDVPLAVQVDRHALVDSLKGYKYIPVQAFGYNFHNYYKAP